MVTNGPPKRGSDIRRLQPDMGGNAHLFKKEPPIGYGGGSDVQVIKTPVRHFSQGNETNIIQGKAGTR